VSAIVCGPSAPVAGGLGKPTLHSVGEPLGLVLAEQIV
jgi:hypothetical protein